jgi:hypothetical protein
MKGLKSEEEISFRRYIGDYKKVPIPWTSKLCTTISIAVPLEDWKSSREMRNREWIMNEKSPRDLWKMVDINNLDAERVHENTISRLGYMTADNDSVQWIDEKSPYLLPSFNEGLSVFNNTEASSQIIIIS